MDETIANESEPIPPPPFIPNRHERRVMEAEYRRQYGKAALAKIKAEYKDAKAKAKGEIKDDD